MAWIKTVPLSQASQELQDSIEESMKMYPVEYSVPVESLIDPNCPDSGAAIVMAHSLIPGALKHAFSTFGMLLSPDLPLSRNEHALIAATVSALNACYY